MINSTTIYAVGGEVVKIRWYCEAQDAGPPPTLVPVDSLEDVKIQIREDSTDDILDWDDDIFKAEAWTTKQGTLAEFDSAEEPGTYEIAWTLPSGAEKYIVTGFQAGGEVAILLRMEIVVDAWPKDILDRLPAALVGGAMDSDVSAMQADVVTAEAIAADAIGASEVATDAIGALEFAASAVTKIAAGIPTNSSIADAVLDNTMAGHDTSDSLAVNIRMLKAFALGNYTFDNIAYDGNGFMTSGRLRLWDSSGNTPSSGGGAETTGLLATVTLTGSPDSGRTSLPSFVRGRIVET